ncbi:ABC transporter substrate-binding protein [Streptomyces asiaticus]
MKNLPPPPTPRGTPGPHRAPPSPSPGPGTAPRRTVLRWAAAAGALATAGTATACAGSRAASVRTSGPVTLSLWTHDQGYQDFFTRSVPRADRATRFSYRLRVTRAGAQDLVTKLLAQAVAGRGTPDLMGFEIGNFARMLRGDLSARLLRDWTEDVAPLGDDLLAARRAPYTVDGRLYALDSDTPATVYYYRDDLLSKYGIPADLGTWEEVARAGARLYDKHRVSLGAVSTGSDLNQVVQLFAILLYQRGGALFDAHAHPTLDSPEAEETLRFICDGLRTGFLVDVADFYGPSMQTALKRGSVAGLWMASWYKTFGLQPNVPEQSGRWRIRALPRFSAGGGRTSVAGGTGFTAITGKANTEAGADFLSATWLTEEAQIRRYRELGYLPTRRSVFRSPELLALEDTFCGGQRLFEVYAPLVDHVPAYYQSPDQSILMDVLSGYLIRAYRGDLSPREALWRATSDFRAQASR